MLIREHYGVGSWRPVVHDFSLPADDALMNNFKAFNLRNVRGKGTGVVSVGASQEFAFVGQYPNAGVCQTEQVRKHGHCESTEYTISLRPGEFHRTQYMDFDPLDQKGAFVGTSNEFLAPRLNEPTEPQHWDDVAKFHPNAHFVPVVCEETRQVRFEVTLYCDFNYD